MRRVVFGLCVVVAAFAAERPRVRAVTAFVRIDARNFESQFAETMKFLNSAGASYQAAGFDVDSLRVATQPFPEYIRGMKSDEAVALLKRIDVVAKKLGFRPAIGPADDAASINVLAKALDGTGLNATVVTADESGIRWGAIRDAAKLVRQLGTTPKGRGNLNFAAIAMVKPYGPFYPGAWHRGQGKTFAVGLESANVVAEVFAATHDPIEAEGKLAAALGRWAKDAETVATALAAKSGWTYAGVDPTPAPMGEVSIARAIESFTGAPFGASGTMTAASVITRAVRSTPVKQTGFVGLMLPLLHDNVLARRWAEGAFSVDSLLAYSSVCAAGLDLIPLRGDVTEAEIAKILGDVASLAFKWQKPLAARLLPVPGGRPGQRTNFGDPRAAETVIR